MKQIEIAACLAAFAALWAAPAAAQATRYPVQNINFDLWCQEQQKLPPERCDKRLPEDEKLFEAYRDKIEKYEVPYLQSRENQQEINRVILHNDPVDQPKKPSVPPADIPVNAPPR